jgi:hypothetical protein
MGQGLRCGGRDRQEQEGGEPDRLGRRLVGELEDGDKDKTRTWTGGWISGQSWTGGG